MENTNQTQPQSTSQPLAIGSLVLGIIAAIISFIPCLGTFAVIPGIIGIVLGAVALGSANKRGLGKGLAIAGLVLSLVGTGIAAVQYFVLAEAAEASKGSLEQLQKTIDSTAKANAEQLDQIQQAVDTLTVK